MLVIAPLAFGFRAPLPLPSSLRGPRAFSGKAAGPLQASNESPVWFGHAKPLLSLFLATSLVFHPNLDGPVLPFGVFNAPSAHAKVGSMGSNVAKEMASGSGSRVNKDADSLLRYGLPINSPKVRTLQAAVEGVKNDLATKRFNAAKDGVKKAKTIANGKDSEVILKATRDESAGTERLKDLRAALEQLDDSVAAVAGTEKGSVQERTALDVAFGLQDKAARIIGDVEELMIPDGFKVNVPDSYDGLPRLRGRATVEMKFEKPGKAPFDIEGALYKTAKMTMVVDGYTSPVTSGNFVELVNKGFYNNFKIQRSDGFVVQTGDPDGEAVGYVADGGKSAATLGSGKKGERLIPLEIFIKGDKAPTYETTIEDDGRGGEATVLPFSSYGAMGWARDEYEANSGSSQFFWLLFDSDLTPAGKNVLDGRYPCFGYVTEGSDFLRDIKEGDVIVEAKVVDGADRITYQ